MERVLTLPYQGIKSVPNRATINTQPDRMADVARENEWI